MERQADAIGIPLEKVYLPSAGGQPCTNAVYEEIMDAVMIRYKSLGVEHVASRVIHTKRLFSARKRDLAERHPHPVGAVNVDFGGVWKGAAEIGGGQWGRSIVSRPHPLPRSETRSVEA